VFHEGATTAQKRDDHDDKTAQYEHVDTDVVGVDLQHVDEFGKAGLGNDP
jgi:hypothetical protein